jgi:hypothetical protein
LCGDDEVDYLVSIQVHDVSTQRSNIANNYHQNENNEVHLYSPQVQQSSKTLIFDTKDWFQELIQTSQALPN